MKSASILSVYPKCREVADQDKVLLFHSKIEVVVIL